MVAKLLRKWAGGACGVRCSGSGPEEARRRGARRAWRSTLGLRGQCAGCLHALGGAAAAALPARHSPASPRLGPGPKLCGPRSEPAPLPPLPARLPTQPRHIRWDTETLGCVPSLSSIPALEQRPLVEALAEVRAWMDAVGGSLGRGGVARFIVVRFVVVLAASLGYVFCALRCAGGGQGLDGRGGSLVRVGWVGWQAGSRAGGRMCVSRPGQASSIHCQNILHV